jgi:hypothetical protein
LLQWMKAESEKLPVKAERAVDSNWNTRATLNHDIGAEKYEAGTMTEIITSMRMIEKEVLAEAITGIIMPVVIAPGETTRATIMMIEEGVLIEAMAAATMVRAEATTAETAIA